MKTDGRIALLAAPGFGAVDNWLPVVDSLARKHGLVIDLVFISPSSIRPLSKKEGLVRLSDGIFSKIIVFDETDFYIFNSFTDALKCYKQTITERFLVIFGVLIRSMKLSQIPVSRVSIFGGKTTTVSRKKPKTKMNRLTHSVFLYDASVEDKAAVQEILNRTNLDSSFFSMLHGLGAHWYYRGYPCMGKSFKINHHLIVFAYSPKEVTGYKKCFGMEREKIKTMGIPRHDADWIERVLSDTRVSRSAKKTNKSAILFDRPEEASSFPRKQKNKNIKILKEVLLKRYGYTLVVKLHPKQSDIAVLQYLLKYRMMFYWLLGRLKFSKEHPFSLIDSSDLVLTFYSGLAIDANKLRKPVIEMSDYRGLPSSACLHYPRDSSGAPVSSYHMAGLIENVKSAYELDAIIRKNSQNDFLEVIKRQNKRYCALFPSEGNVIDMICGEILSEINA